MSQLNEPIASAPVSYRPSRHAWFLLAGAFVTFSVGAGMMHSYTVFLIVFIQDFAWSRAEASIAYSVAQFVTGISSPLVGLLVDRLGPYWMILLGGALLVLGLLGSSQVHELWQLIVLYGVIMTLGSNCLGLVVFVPLLSRHFVRQRGMAVAVLQSANGFARAFSAPGAQALISGIGWRDAYLTQAGFMAFVMLPLAAIFRRADRPVLGAQAQAAPTHSWTLVQAMRSRQFWLLFLVYLCTGVGSFVVSLHQLAFAVDRGFDPLYAASVLGMGGLLSIPGIIVTGILSDYVGREASAMVTYGVSIAGAGAALFITGPQDHVLLWLHASLFGITWGARGPAITAKTADLFPGRQLGAILGVITIGSGLGSAVGSWAAGFIFDMSHSYRLAFIVSMCAYAAGCVAFYALRRRSA